MSSLIASHLSVSHSHADTFKSNFNRELGLGADIRITTILFESPT